MSQHEDAFLGSNDNIDDGIIDINDSSALTHQGQGPGGFSRERVKTPPVMATPTSFPVSANGTHSREDVANALQEWCTSQGMNVQIMGGINRGGYCWYGDECHPYNRRQKCPKVNEKRVLCDFGVKMKRSAVDGQWQISNIVTTHTPDCIRYHSTVNTPPQSKLSVSSSNNNSMIPFTIGDLVSSNSSIPLQPMPSPHPLSHISSVLPTSSSISTNAHVDIQLPTNLASYVSNTMDLVGMDGGSRSRKHRLDGIEQDQDKGNSASPPPFSTFLNNSPNPKSEFSNLSFPRKRPRNAETYNVITPTSTMTTITTTTTNNNAQIINGNTSQQQQSQSSAIHDPPTFSNRTDLARFFATLNLLDQEDVDIDSLIERCRCRLDDLLEVCEDRECFEMAIMYFDYDNGGILKCALSPRAKALTLKKLRDIKKIK